MKFKKGQKVRIKDWVNMPQYIKNSYIGTPQGLVGKHGIIDSIDYYESKRTNNQVYVIDFISDSLGKYLLFESELELLVQVGEQLLFSFMNEED